MEALGLVASAIGLVELTNKIVQSTDRSLTDPEIREYAFRLHQSCRALAEGMQRYLEHVPNVQLDGQAAFFELNNRTAASIMFCSDELRVLIRSRDKAGLKFQARSPSLMQKIRWNSKKKELQERLSIIELEVDKLRSLVSAELALQSMSSTRTVHAQNIGYGSMLLEIEDRHVQFGALFSEALNRLSDDHSIQQSRNFSMYCRGTGDWFFNHEEFKLWLNEPGKIIWLEGPPGVGKSVLCSAVVDFLLSQYSKPNLVVTYCYLQCSNPEASSSERIVASLWRQLIRQVPNPTFRFNVQQSEDTTQFNTDMLLNLLVDTLYDHEKLKRMFIILDGYDEGDLRNSRDLLDLEPLLNHPYVNVLFTSRATRVYEAVFHHATHIRFPVRNDGIRTYSIKQLEADKSLGGDPHQNDDIIDQLVGRSEGSFLWAHLVTQNLTSTDHGHLNEPRRQALMNFLKTDSHVPLDQIYETLVSSLSNIPRALEILAWVCFAQRPLSIEELQSAAAIDLNDPRIDDTQALDVSSMTTLCCHLIAVDSTADTRRVLLLHVSLKQYLTQHLDKWLHREFTWTNACNTFIAKTCLAYLCLQVFNSESPNEFGDLGEEPTRFPLLDYAANFWGWHAFRADLNDFSDNAMTLFASEAKTRRAGLMMAKREIFTDHYEPAYRGIRPLHIAVIFKLGDLARHLIASGHDVNATTFDCWSALHWAAREDSEEIVPDLLAANALTEIKTKVDKWTPLHLAAKEGHHRIVKLLLDHGAEVDAQDTWGRTPLYLACWSGKGQVLHVLLSHPRKADAKISNIHGATPLHCAARNGDKEIVEALLKHSEIGATDVLGYTALDEATRKGYTSIASILSAQNEPWPGDSDGSQPMTASSSLTSSTLTSAELRWSQYVVDSERTSVIHQGRQCFSQVMQPLSGVTTSHPRVFCKTFSLAFDRQPLARYFTRERRILHRIRHPNIVAYLDFEEDPDQNALLLYMEYCDMGDLAQLHGLPCIPDQSDDDSDSDGNSSGAEDECGFYSTNSSGTNGTNPLNGKEVWALVYQISSALAYLHHGLSVGDRSTAQQVYFQRSWEPIIHRDIKPANIVLQRCEDGTAITKLCDLGIATEAGAENPTQYVASAGFRPPEVARGNTWTTQGDIYCLGETIKSTFKLRDEEEQAIRKLINDCGKKEGKRPDSLRIMDLAYSKLQQTDGFEGLPRAVIQQSGAIHQLLGNEEGGYLLQAFKFVAEMLDTVIPIDHEPAKVHREKTLVRLKLLWDSGAKTIMSEFPFEHTAIILVLLSQAKQLDKFLTSHRDTNVQWRQSRWTPLHIAAQEGKLEMVKVLLKHKANKNMKDVHGLRAVDYAKQGGLSEVFELLQDPSTSSKS